MQIESVVEMIASKRREIIDKCLTLPDVAEVRRRAEAAGYFPEMAEQVARGYACDKLKFLAFNVERYDWLTWRDFERKQNTEGRDNGAKSE